MNISITLTSQELVEIIKEKYKADNVNYVNLTLKETKEHWQSRTGKSLSEEVKNPLKTVHVRMYEDGSYDHEWLVSQAKEDK